MTNSIGITVFSKNLAKSIGIFGNIWTEMSGQVTDAGTNFCNTLAETIN